MPRYRSHGNLDDPFTQDGDVGFLGLDTLSEPTLLEAGMLKEAQNVRINSGVVETRKGLTKIKDFADGKALVKFSDPNGVEDILMVSHNQVTGVFTEYDIPIQNPFSIDDEINGIQAFEKVFLFSEDHRPKRYTDGASQFTDFPNTSTVNDALFLPCPNTSFGTYMANRLVVLNPEDSSTSIICSDILDENNFQKSTGEFFVNKGTSDRTFSLFPFPENQLIVLNNKSIHIVGNIHSLDSTNFEISRQYGIAGTRCAVASGSYIYFISNEGDFQVLVPSSDPAKGLGISISKATLDSEPLSKKITPVIDRINISKIHKSIVHYHRNKVYFAIPLDDEQVAQTIVVYDSLRSQFVSVDKVPIEIRDMASIGDKLIILSENHVFEYESGDTDDGADIVSRVTTRDFTMRATDVKNFTTGSVAYSATDGSQMQVIVQTQSPDKTILSKVINSTGTDDSLDKFNIKSRGHSASVTVDSIGGRFGLKRVNLQGFITGRTEGSFDGN
jgi:hypothetical protein